jgi:hypothetical protein
MSVQYKYRIETSQSHHFPWSWKFTLERDSGYRSYAPGGDETSEAEHHSSMCALRRYDSIE